MRCKVADTIGHRYHHQVVLYNMIAVLIEHETTLTCQAKQMHTSVTQLTGIHPIEVCGILEICLHDCNVAIKRMQNEVCFSYAEREQLRRIQSAKLHIILYTKE